MTVLEKKSLRKKKAIMSLVEKGEYSVAYALMLVEELSDAGKLTDNDYEELAEFLENLLNEEENEEVAIEEEPTETNEEAE
ncbi:MAG TPA: hypothetical protein DEP51_03720 [Clostridiales bacterium]|nr:hypothetical protein [Clostridiales bacterium]